MVNGLHLEVGMKLCRIALPLLSALLLLLSILGSSEITHAVGSPYPGYIDNVEKEKSERFVEIYLYSPPTHREQSLQEMIFNPLTTEFKQKYREKFGQLDSESI